MFISQPDILIVNLCTPRFLDIVQVTFVFLFLFVLLIGSGGMGRDGGREERGIMDFR